MKQINGLDPEELFETNSFDYFFTQADKKRIKRSLEW